MKILVIYRNPSIGGFRPDPPQIAEKPRNWQGIPVRWNNDDIPPLVFIEQFVFNDVGQKTSRDLLLYGIRHDLTDMILDGAPVGGGYFVEYLVHEFRSGKPYHCHRLSQQMSILFSDTSERKDYLPVELLRQSNEFVYKRPPCWLKSDLVWPTLRGAPMTFVGEVFLPENKVSKRYLTWNKTIYLFGGDEIGREMRYKIMTRDSAAQSDEDHYASEEDS